MIAPAKHTKHFTLGADGIRIPDPTYITNREEGLGYHCKNHSRSTLPEIRQTSPKDPRRSNCIRRDVKHYLGLNKVDNMATMAEDNLKSTVYNGERRRWDFE
jgi:hypothetical protein